MAKLSPPAGRVFFLCGFLLVLASCATPAARKISAAPEQMGVPKGTIISGVVVAMRPVTAQAPLSEGSSAVLSALQIAPPATTPNATEFVIQRADGNVAAIVVRSPAASPEAAMSAANFSVGDHVELITGVQTELIHSNP